MTQGVTLVLGGAASGKSTIAETLALACGGDPLYIATAQRFDTEMAQKIAAHVAARGNRWTTIEEPFDLARALDHASPDHTVLIDCATLWLTNLMLEDRDLAAEEEALFGALASCPAPVVIVSNEVGQGIVPDNALARRFREAQGRLNIRLAARAETVVHVVAGLPNLLKGKMP
ncbi:bifunctional adenosylcobinamide kinase/adenosylcobinamide-phosphate guanylyltransferase [Pseudooceanicola sp. C21-150M6]|uniref:bifunctional adenosylcobinamide kinase/adenosylcobinamide-phosphate guanylyltransferase n=1 Tax=Pseudooceanicola sp. C21-150M6 TaxID=3434355 RepID=UPI003D7F798B